MMTLLEPKQFYKLDVSRAPKIAEQMLSAYDLEIQIAPRTILKIGRFSFGLLPRLRLFPHPDQILVFEAGALCEAAIDAVFVIGGEHRNATLFNATLGAATHFLRPFMDDEQRLALCPRPARTMRLGDNVVLGTRAVVLDGAQIGEGCVIGAGAVVHGVHEPFGICGGVPARRIRDRCGASLVELWRQTRPADVRAHEMHRLPAALAAVQSGRWSVADFAANIMRMDRRPCLVLGGRVSPLGDVALAEVLGFRVGEDPVEDQSALQTLKAYFGQINSNSDIKWTPDIFHTLGLS